MRLPSRDGAGIVPHAAYDPVLKELFVSTPDVNAVEVYSTTDGHLVGEISVPGPAGLSFSSDYAKLVVGTITPYVYFIDPAKLHVSGRIQLPPSMLVPSQAIAVTLPVMPYAMADGTILLGMGGTSESESLSSVLIVHLVRYDPASGSFTLDDPGPSGITATPTRSLDGKYLLVGSVGGSDQELFLYFTGTPGIAATSTPLQTLNGIYLAANPNGSQFASLQMSGTSTWKVTFWGANLQVQNQYTFSGLSPLTVNPVYSRDGKYLYITTNTGILVVFNTQSGAPTGYLGVSVGSIPFPPQFFDLDESYRLFGAALPGGALMLNASQTQASPPAVIPEFLGPSTEANPNVATIAGTEVQFIPIPKGSGSADGIGSSMEAYFGAIPATKDVVAPYPASSNGENFLTATAPPASNPGPVSVVLTDANNNTVFLPDAFTYEPYLIRVEPNVVSPKGGDIVTIFAYGLGFGDDVKLIHVTVGGAPVTKPPVLNSNASPNYPEQSLTIAVPAGTPGWADITLSTPNGSATLRRGLQYANNQSDLAGGPFTFVIFDRVRDRFYLTGSGNSVAVFDPETQTFLAPLLPSGASPGAVLQSEALTPDGSRLLVADPSDRLIVIFDLTSGASTTANVLLQSDDPATILSPPMSIVAVGNDHAFVSLSPCIPNPVREINLTTFSITARPDAVQTCGTFVPYPEFVDSSLDGSTIVFAGNSGLQPPGPESVWHYDASSDHFTGPVLIADNPWIGAGKPAVSGDGTAIAVGQGMLDQKLAPLLPFTDTWLDSRLNDTGSLLFGATIAAITEKSIFVSDTHNGRRLLMIGLPAGIGPFRPFAIDPTGRKILASREGGVSYFELSVVPLAVGSVSPAQASPGMNFQLHGSGFVPNMTAKIGGQNAVCSEVDSETLSCTVPNLPPGPAFIALTNPDGQTYLFESAFAVQ